MQSNKNKVIIASAGSRKTTHIVESALDLKDKKILITTYTNENLDQINTYLIQKNRVAPKNITVVSWFSFLLQDGVRPYQNHLTSKGRVDSICFTEIPEAIKKRFKKSNVDNYFLTSANNIYRDRVADFVCECDDRSNGLVVKRLEKIYNYIFIDEVQDFAGYDFTLLEKLLKSSISIVVVGDPRQGTFSTNNSTKNKRFKKNNIIEWINIKKKAGLLDLECRNECYRCNQVICDFADALFPSFSKTISKNFETTPHDGIFFIKPDEVLDYVKTHNPKILRYSVKTETLGLPAVNFGSSKGRTYERVLIFPTQSIKDYLKNRDLSKLKDQTKAKFYVAITRAKHSVAFVI
jgi:superfamily I DNA/RNA helicase